MAPNKKIRLKVASPCNERWSDMVGDDSVRFCGKCDKNVYQLSNMSAGAIEDLLAGKAGDVCARFFQRKDGTVITADCPVGAKRVRRKQAVIGAGAGLLSMVGVGLWAGAGGSPGGAMQGAVVPEFEIPNTEIMGEIEVAEPDAVVTVGEVEPVEMLGSIVATEDIDPPAEDDEVED